MGSGEPAMTLGIPLSEGMDEISLGLTADAYMHSQQVVCSSVWRARSSLSRR
jgi:hypothetical protein